MSDDCRVLSKRGTEGACKYINRGLREKMQARANWAHPFSATASEIGLDLLIGGGRGEANMKG